MGRESVISPLSRDLGGTTNKITNIFADDVKEDHNPTENLAHKRAINHANDMIEMSNRKYSTQIHINEASHKVGYSQPGNCCTPIWLNDTSFNAHNPNIHVDDLYL